ncbi:unnamed protein product [Paramecium primaurelia]|uniref:Uncharacterized protein n=1 Tax=Paramecium primaurelia TaxID=5886 RepID=A0A8S1QL15_PARPR|nr:unnamed protein product [Paramecium primaurelia]
MLKLYQVLNEHKREVVILNLMKQSNQMGIKDLFLFGLLIIKINGFTHKLFKDTVIGLEVQFQIIMNIYLFQVVLIRLLNFG